MVMQAQLPRYRGFEAEGWCSTSCQEAPILEEVYVLFSSKLHLPLRYPKLTANGAANPRPIEDWPMHVITRVSLIRSPIQACAISMMMFSAPRLETLELLDVGAHLWVGSALVDLLRTRSKTLRFLALRLNHQPDHPGVLDNIFEVSAVGGAPSILDHPLTPGDIIDLPTCGSTTRSPGPHFTTFLRPAVASSLPDTPPRIVDGSTHRVFWHRGARRALGEGS
jgi:hypothetical protein